MARKNNQTHNDTAGIHDPWRMHTPDWTPPAERDFERDFERDSGSAPPAGTQHSDLPFDWDLQPHKSFHLRIEGASVCVDGVDNAQDATARLLQLFDTDATFREALQSQGFERGATQDAHGFVLHVGDHALSCAKALSARDGMYRLCHALRRIPKHCGVSPRIT